MARRRAKESATGGGTVTAEISAQKWKEEVEEARSVIDGTHPKLAGLENKDLGRRKDKYAAPP